MTTTAAGPLCRLEGRARALADAARSYTADPVRRADIDRLRARIEWNIGSATVGHRILLQGARDVAGTGPDRACEMAMIAAAAATFGADSGIDIDPTEFIGDTNLVGSPRTRCFALLLAGFADVGHGRLADPAGCFRQAFADCDPAGDVDLLSNLGIMYADPASLAAGASGCVAADYLSQLDPMSGDDEGAAVSTMASTSCQPGTCPAAQRIGIAMGAVSGKIDAAVLQPLPGSDVTTVIASR